MTAPLETVRPPAEWKLTPTETDVLDAIIAQGQVRRVADALNMGFNTVRAHCCHIRDKAGVDSMLLVAVAWDRYSRRAAS